MKSIAVVLIGVMAATAAQQRFRSGVDVVTVDVLITRDGRPVTGLTVADFELRDNGVRQRVQSAVVEDVPLDVLVALDTSASVAGDALRHLKEAAAATIALLTARDQAALLCFNESIKVWVPWTSDQQAMTAHIDAVQASGGTSLHDAAFAALTLASPRAGARRLVLLFTDGQDTTGWLPGQNVIEAARRTESVVYGFGLRRSADADAGYRLDFRSGLQPRVPQMLPPALAESFVEKLPVETGGRYIEVEDSSKLRDAFVDILTESRRRYVLTYTPTGVAAGGWHQLKVSLTRSAGTVRARRGYIW